MISGQVVLVLIVFVICMKSLVPGCSMFIATICYSCRVISPKCRLYIFTVVILIKVHFVLVI